MGIVVLGNRCPKNFELKLALFHSKNTGESVVTRASGEVS